MKTSITEVRSCNASADLSHDNSKVDNTSCFGRLVMSLVLALHARISLQSNSGSLFRSRISSLFSHFTDSKRNTKPPATSGSIFFVPHFSLLSHLPLTLPLISLRWRMRLWCACRHGYGLYRFDSWQSRLLPRRIGMWCLLPGTVTVIHSARMNIYNPLCMAPVHSLIAFSSSLEWCSQSVYHFVTGPLNLHRQ